MELLFISHKYPPSIGGMQKHSYELATRLKQYATIHTIIYREGTSRLGFFLNLKRNIKKALREHPHISLIYLNDALMSTLTIWLKKYTHIPIVASFHGLDLVFPSQIYQQKIVPKFPQLDAIIAVSQATAEECLRRGIHKDRLYTINNGIDRQLINYPHNRAYLSALEHKTGRNFTDKRLLVAMGRPVRRKGFCWFVKNVLPQLGEDTLLIIIGPESNAGALLNRLFACLPTKLRRKIELFFGIGTDGFELRQLLSDPRYKKQLLHLGQLPTEDIVQILAIADLFIVPNIKVEGDFEGFGLVALEAAICAAPVLAAKVDGLTDAVIDGKNGFLVASQNAGAWVEKIRHLLSNREFLRAFGQRAQAFTAMHYDWELMVRQYYQVFQTVVARSNTYEKNIKNALKRPI